MKLKNKTVDRLKKDYGNWALVTGATSGIGKALATKLAEAGFNLVITGRRETQLNSLSTEFFDQYNVESIPIVGDLSRKEAVDSLLEETNHLSIGIVILNAGFGTSGKFVNSDIQNELNLVDLNCKAVLQMSHHFCNKMKDETRKGAIVLLSSMVAFQGVPNAANYGASKAYIQSFGEGLARELKPFGIDILCAAPGPVKSGFADRANMNMGMSLLPEDIAIPIIKAIGKKSTLLPGFLTKFLVYSLRLLPRWGKIRVMEKVMGGFTKHQK
ncbi:SDR family NAD(P)-dependent oxidoreductase [Winogradskyella poriferorum]|uniref:SDR family NAD(P)-dependent oxidoreductase n=1 Tax=Winogradskyella poriferorum TaxID=307627 RepID=UPI003D6520EE